MGIYNGERVALAIVNPQTDLVRQYRGRVSFQGFEETIPKNRKTFRKQEAYSLTILLHTASVRAVLWEGDIEKIQWSWLKGMDER